MTSTTPPASGLRPLDVVLPDREAGARTVLEAHLALLEDLAADPTPWEWWVDQWARNGWTIVQNGSVVNIDKNEDHSRDMRSGEFGVPCHVDGFASGEAAVRHVLDVLRAVVAHVPSRDDEERVSAWMLTLAATRHPCGALPDIVGLPSPFRAGLSQPPNGPEDAPPPEGTIGDMLSHAPCVLSWAAGSWSGNAWISISNVDSICGQGYDTDPNADPVATLRAIERVRGEMP